MSPTLILASDFIERMANPAYGIRVNEDHALRFAMLLRDERFFSILENEAKLLTSRDDLTPHGWLWLLTWARSHEIRLDEQLLLDLADTWSSVSMQVLVISAAIVTSDKLTPQERHNLEFSRTKPIPPVRLSEIKDSFLRRLLQGVTRIPETEIRRETFSTQRAQDTLVALLQLNQEITLEAANSLLHHEWNGQAALQEFYRMLRGLLDVETQKAWDLRLGNHFQEDSDAR